MKKEIRKKLGENGYSNKAINKISEWYDDKKINASLKTNSQEKGVRKVTKTRNLTQKKVNKSP